MALVVFLRGVNVGSHKRCLPAQLARDLAAFDLVNVGAAGTFVVRAPVRQATLLAEMRVRLAFDADIIIVKGSDLIEFARSAPFGQRAAGKSEQRFLSIMAARARIAPTLPLICPPTDAWQVKVIAVWGRFAASIWRRGPGTPTYPNAALEKHFGVSTTRNWNTVETICKILQP
jgi:uncharacterized protein (DUF1697 family)